MPKLTEKFITGFRPENGQKDRLAFDTEVKGLGLRATASGSRQFLVQWTDKATGKKVRTPLGAWGAITLDQARSAARIQLGRLASGFDPKAESDARKADAAAKHQAKLQAQQEAAYTLDRLIEDWTSLHLVNRREAYAREATRALRLAFKQHLAAPAKALDHHKVGEVLDALVAAGKATTAHHTKAYGRGCYAWAVQRRKLQANPFEGLPPIEGGNASRERVLTDSEVGAIWRAACALRSPHGAFMRFRLLTLARRTEVAGMSWGEVTPDLSIWAQPGRRTKNHQPHIVHLSGPAREVLREMLGVVAGEPIPALPTPDRLVFPVADNSPITAFSWVQKALKASMQAENDGAAQDWVGHDFRRTAVTLLAEAGTPVHIADRLLNHVGRTISGVALVYQKAQFQDERQKALDAWAAHVLRCAECLPETQA